MILDTLANSARCEAAHPWLAPAFAWLRQHATSALATGRHEIDGDRLFALVAHYATRDYESAEPEAHRKYVDVQYLVSGHETVYWTPLAETAAVSEAYDETRDLMFFERNARTRAFELRTGDFVVFFPEDAHEPNCHLGPPGDVHKAVVKVRLP